MKRATWAGLALGALAGVLVTGAIIRGDTGGDSTAGLVGFAIVPVGIAMGGVIGNGVERYDWNTRWKRT